MYEPLFVGTLMVLYLLTAHHAYVAHRAADGAAVL